MESSKGDPDSMLGVTSKDASGLVRILKEQYGIEPFAYGPSEKRVAVQFDPEATTKEQIIELLLALSDVYRALGGEGLIIRDSSAYSRKSRGVPVV